MKTNLLYTLIMVFSLSACMSVPPETISLSRTIGQDLAILQESHRNMAELQFVKIKQDINAFVDDVYAPFIINFVLQEELKNYKKKQPSLFGSIEVAGKSSENKDLKEALDMMSEFHEAANEMINEKRSELLAPILTQQTQILENIRLSYEHVAYGNASITNYLESIHKMKQTQGRALERVGLTNTASSVNNSLTRVSTFVSTILEKAKDIDIRSHTASDEIDEISKQIKDINKNN